MGDFFNIKLSIWMVGFRNCLVVQGKLDCLILYCCCDFHEQLTAYEEQLVAGLTLFAMSSVGRKKLPEFPFLSVVCCKVQDSILVCARFYSEKSWNI